MPDPVTVSREDHLAIVSLSHPDRLNVLDRQGWEALANAMTAPDPLAARLRGRRGDRRQRGGLAASISPIQPSHRPISLILLPQCPARDSNPEPTD